jgi:hypothetical protein
MAETVFLHVGAPKCGTTFLQSALWANRDTLAGRGLLVPGKRPFDHNRASMAIRRSETEPAGPRSPGAVWQRLKDEIAGWDGSAVISQEWLSLASADQAAEAVRQLRPARVEIVVTARNLVGQVSAAWQETVKIGRSHRLDEFVSSLDSSGSNGPSAGGGEERWRWSALDPALILDTWAHVIPRTQAHVVTVPPRGSDPSLLWSRFAAACGIGPDPVDLGVVRANESLSSEAAALMQRIGPRLREAVEASPPYHWSQPYKWIRELVGHQILVPQGGTPIGLRDAQVAELQERSVRVRDAIERAGYPVSGDLDDLLAAPSGPARHPDDVGADEVNALAITVITALLTRLRAESEGHLDEAVGSIDGEATRR